MATIILDGQSKSWKVKATVDGKDKRVTLRKARQGEPRKPIPDDLVVLAASKGFKVETIPTRAAIPEGSPTTTTGGEIGGMIAAFLADYRQQSRPGSVIRMEGVLRDFDDYLATRPTLATIGEVTPDVVMDYFA